jgi:hypothetical protein
LRMKHRPDGTPFFQETDMAIFRYHLRDINSQGQRTR